MRFVNLFLFFTFILINPTSAQIISYPTDSIAGPPPTYSRFGYSVDVKDINLDGYADILVGEPGQINEHQSYGYARIYSGADLSLMVEIQGTFGTEPSGYSWREEIGRKVIFLDDYYGSDGIPEFAVWGSHYQLYQINNDFYNGRFVIYDGATFTPIDEFAGERGECEPGNRTLAALKSYQEEGDTGPSGTLDSYTYNGYPNIIYMSDSARNCIACSGRRDFDVFTTNTGSLTLFNSYPSWKALNFVENAGDVNRDFYPDYIGGSRGGGGNTGIDTVRIFSGADNTIIKTIVGISIDENYGFYGVGVGDIDNDGYDDVGLNVNNGGNSTIGIRFFSGKLLSDGTTPINDCILSEDYWNWGYWEPQTEQGNFLKYGPAGDINGDGNGDIIIGWPRYNMAYILSGGDFGGGSATRLMNIWGPGPTNGNNPKGFAFDVHCGEDVDGDGLIDAVVGSHHNGNTSGYSRVYIYSVEKDYLVSQNNTQPGTDVLVEIDDYDITYDEVTDMGNTTIEEIDCAPPPPDGYKLIPASLGICFDISSDASYTDSIHICYDYTAYADGVSQERNMKIMHYDGHWNDVTTDIDTLNNIICGTTDHLSPFAIVESCCSGITGNFDGDELESIDVADLVFMVEYQFLDSGIPSPCPIEADIAPLLNPDGLIDIADLVIMVDYQFLDGPAPPDCP